MAQTISNEYDRSVTRVREMRDRAFQIARISGIILSIFGAAVVFAILRGTRVSIPVFILTASIVVISVSGIIVPLLPTFVFRTGVPQVLRERPLRLAQRGVLSDRDLTILMILCLKINRSYVERCDRCFKWASVLGVILGTVMLAGALVAISMA